MWVDQVILMQNVTIGLELLIYSAGLGGGPSLDL